MDNKTDRTPQVSVVVSLYNKERYIRRALDSVLTQTFKDFELLVINDGSTDKSMDRVSSFIDKRIKVFNQDNMGVSSARNKGIKEARAGLIAFLDADDEWKSDFLETVMDLYEQYPECHVFATNYWLCDESGSCSRLIINGLPHDFSRGVIRNYFHIVAASDPLLCSSAIMVKKDALISAGGFPEGVGIGEDLLMWSRLATKFNIAYTKKECSLYHRTSRPELRKGTFSIISEGFTDLIDEAAQEDRNDLKNYAALIHRGRGVVLLRTGNVLEARDVFKRAMLFSSSSLRLYMYFVLSFFPVLFTKNIMKLFDRLNRLRRMLR